MEPNKNIEMMKKIIEEKKKNKGIDQNVRPDKKIGGSRKAFNNKKTGGSLTK